VCALNSSSSQRKRLVHIGSNLILLLGWITILVIPFVSHTPFMLTVPALWTLIGIYKLGQWYSHSSAESSQQKAWHRQPDVLWILASALIVLMSLIKMGIQSLHLPDVLATVDEFLLGVPALLLLVRVYTVERGQKHTFQTSK
jgi:hypothetical protein